MKELVLSGRARLRSSWKEDVQTAGHEWMPPVHREDGDCVRQSWRLNGVAGAHGGAGGGGDMADGGK